MAMVMLLLFPGTARSVNQPGDNRSDSLRAVELYREAVEKASGGDAEEALSLFMQSLHYREKVFGKVHYRLGSTYMGMAIQYKNLHQLDKAYSTFRTAEQMYLSGDLLQDSRLGNVYSNIGNYYYARGNLEEALRYHERSVAIFRQAGPAVSEENFLSARYNLANIYYRLNRETEALTLAESIRNSGDLPFRINVNNLIANILTLQNEVREAGVIHKQNIRMLLGEEGPGGYLLADQYSVYAQFLTLTGQTDSAIAYLRKAEGVYLRYRNSQTDLADNYRFMGDAYATMNVTSASSDEFRILKGNNLLTAIDFYQKALQTLNGKAVADSLALADLANPVSTLQILRDLGRTYRQLAGTRETTATGDKTNDLTRAIFFLLKGSSLVEQMRTGFITEESKILFTALQQEIVQNTTATAFDLYLLTDDLAWAEMAFLNAEQNKAASLFDKLTDERARSLVFIPDSIREKEQSIQANLVYYREKLFREKAETADEVRIADIEARIFQLEEEFNKLQDYLEANYGKYYQLKYKTEPSSFRTLQSMMKRNEVILSYARLDKEHTGKEALLMFCITRKGVRAVRRDADNAMEGEIRQLVGFLSDPDFMQTDRRKFMLYTTAARSLYKKLVAPFAGDIPGKRITVIPDDLLSHLPFEALLTREATAGSIHFHDLPYLILENPVRYVYSAQLYASGKPGGAQFDREAAAFSPDYGNAYYPGEEPVTLPDLAGIREEAAYLARRNNTDWYDGKEATEERFRKEAGRYRILHLATHTLVNDTAPLFSRFAFFPEAHGTLTNDGWLTTADIYTLDLPCRLAVLSGCHTGSGILAKGEGRISLARGFLYAGCPSVIMTLWEVEDRTGATITQTFYRNLMHGKSVDRALQNAKAAHIRQADPLSAHPHLWLGYVAVGDPSPLFPGQEKYLLAGLVVLLIIVTAEMLIRKKLATQRKKGET